MNKRLTTRLLSMLLAVMMLVGMLPMSVLAAGTTQSEIGDGKDTPGEKQTVGGTYWGSYANHFIRLTLVRVDGVGYEKTSAGVNTYADAVLKDGVTYDEIIVDLYYQAPVGATTHNSAFDYYMSNHNKTSVSGRVDNSSYGQIDHEGVSGARRSRYHYVVTASQLSRQLETASRGGSLMPHLSDGRVAKSMSAFIIDTSDTSEIAGYHDLLTTGSFDMAMDMIANKYPTHLLKTFVAAIGSTLPQEWQDYISGHDGANDGEKLISAFFSSYDKFSSFMTVESGSSTQTHTGSAENGSWGPPFSNSTARDDANLSPSKRQGHIDQEYSLYFSSSTSTESAIASYPYMIEKGSDGKLTGIDGSGIWNTPSAGTASSSMRSKDELDQTGYGMWLVQGFTPMVSADGGLEITKSYAGNERSYNSNAATPLGSYMVNGELDIKVEFAGGVSPATGGWPTSLPLWVKGYGGNVLGEIALTGSNGTYTGTFGGAIGDHGYMWNGDTIFADYSIAGSATNSPVKENSWGEFITSNSAIMQNAAPFAKITVTEKGFDSEGYQIEASAPSESAIGTRVKFEGDDIVHDASLGANTCVINLMKRGSSVTMLDYHEMIRIEKEVSSNLSELTKADGTPFDFTKDSDTNKVTVGSDSWGRSTFGQFLFVLNKKGEQGLLDAMPRLYMAAEQVKSYGQDIDNNTNAGAYVWAGGRDATASGVAIPTITAADANDVSNWLVINPSDFGDNESLFFQMAVREGYRVLVVGLPESGVQGQLTEWSYNYKYENNGSGNFVATGGDPALRDNVDWSGYYQTDGSVRGTLVVDEANFAANGSTGNLPVRGVTMDETTFELTSNGVLDDKFVISKTWSDYTMSGETVVKSDSPFQARSGDAARHSFDIDESTADLFLFTNVYGSSDGGPVGDGTCHLVIDLNMNNMPLWALDGKKLSDGSTVSATPSLVSGTQITLMSNDSFTIDCGTLENDSIIKGLPNLVSQIGTVSLGTVTVKVTKNGQDYETVSVPVVAKPKGIYTAASNGSLVGDEYKLNHQNTPKKSDGSYKDHLHTLFVQWELDVPPKTVDVKCDTCDVAESKIVPVYWDLGYYGAGIASSNAGFSLTYGASQTLNVDGWDPVTVTPVVSTWYVEAPYGENHEDTGDMGDSWRYKPVRVGWRFLGWVETNPKYGKAFTDTDGGLYAAATSSGVPIRNWLLDGRMNSRIQLQNWGVIEGNEAGTYLGEGAVNYFHDYSFLEADLEEACESRNLDALQSHTYRAIWLSEPIVAHSMGGEFYSRSAENTGHAEKLNVFDSSKDVAGVAVPHLKWGSDMHTNIAEHPCETYVNNGYQTSEDNYIPVIPYCIRPGYTLMGWYYDPYCVVPLNEYETGLQPGRSYFAGWQAEEITVNYYDTREGTTYIGSQNVKYGDVVDLFHAVKDTAGWSYVCWRDADGKDMTAAAQSANEWTLESFMKETTMRRYAQTGNIASETTDWHQVDIYDIAGVLQTASFENEGRWELDLFADYDIKTTSYTVQVHWDDYYNNDGCRPQSVTVGLVSSVGNTIYVDSSGKPAIQTLTQANAVSGQPNLWQYTFENLPITVSDSNTDVINYSFCFLGYTDRNGNEGEIKDTAATSGNFQVTTPTNNSTDMTTSYNYAVSLYSTPEATWNESARGSGRTGSEGMTIKRSLFSQMMAASGDVDTDTNPNVNHTFQSYSGVLYMTHNLILTGDDIVFTVEWDDDTDRDGIRPESIMLYLYAKAEGEDWHLIQVGADTTAASSDGAIAISSGICDVSSDGNVWTYVFKDYQKYTNQGKILTYGVRIADASGYRTTYMTPGDSPDTNGVIMVHTPATAEVPVTINWDDNLNADNMRPDHVDVALHAYVWNRDTYRWESQDVQNITIKADNTTNTMIAGTWSGTFGVHDVYSGGERIIYRASVISDLNAHLPPTLDTGVNGYDWNEGLIGNPVSVRISHNQNTRDVDVTIVWDDDGNNDTIRPKTVILQLYRHAPGETPTAMYGEPFRVELTGDMTADHWYYTFHDVLKFDQTKPAAQNKKGIEYIYSVRVFETKEDELYGRYIITTNGEEEWVTKYVASYLTGEVAASGQSGAVNTTYDFNQSDRAYVKLTHISETQTRDYFVNWHDDDNRDGVRPTGVQVDIYKAVGDEEPVRQSAITITAGRDGSWMWRTSGMESYENGLPVTYTIRMADDVKAQLETLGYTVAMEDNVIHMYYTPAVGDISTKLEWSDENNNDGYRPDFVMAELYKNGVPTGQKVELNPNNDWSATWTNLPVHWVDGTEVATDVIYNVVVEVPPFYSVDYKPETTTIEAGELLQIRLTHVKDVADIPVTVYWNDETNHDGKRPETVKVMLLIDGKESNYSLDLTADNAIDVAKNVWAGVFENMPVYDGDGREIIYSITVWDDATYNDDYDSLTVGTKLYFSHNIEKSTLRVAVQFDDNNNADGDRPTVLYVQMKVNGELIEGSEYKHTFDFLNNGTTVDFGALPVTTSDGVEAVYSVDVTFDYRFGGQNYRVIQSSPIKINPQATAAQNTITLRLVHDSNTTPVKGNIYWYDANDRAGERPKTLEIVMVNDFSKARANYVLDIETGNVYRARDNAIVGTVTETEWSRNASVWSYVINDLPAKYITPADGRSTDVWYYVEIDNTSIAMEYPVVRDGTSGSATPNGSLTHRFYSEWADKASQDFTVNVMWLDNANEWGRRPNANGVKVELLANGDVYNTVILTEENKLRSNENEWSYTFKNLPTYRAGAGVTWEARVTDQDTYTQTTTVLTAVEQTVKMTQSTGFNFTVRWSDSNNDDAVRPESITLDVYGDGVKLGEVEMTGAGNTWTGSISDLPVWRETNGAVAVNYTFRWNNATETYLRQTGYAAAPTKYGVATEANSFYYLSAEQFGDSADNGYNDLSNTYEWETTLSYDKEVADYYFSITLVDDDDRDGVRPDSLTVKLLADGKVVETREVDINDTDGVYELVFKDKDVKSAGENIVYTMELEAVPASYTASWNPGHTVVTLTHEVELVNVSGLITWDDSTEIVDVFNPNGLYVRSYNQIARANVRMWLLADGEPIDTPAFIGGNRYGVGENKTQTALNTWENMYVNRDHGTKIVYTIKVDSGELQALLDDGHSMRYDFSERYAPEAIITHDLYDIRGTVYYEYTISDDFLLEGVPVTAYLRDEATGTYSAVATTLTDENGQFEFLNLKQGMYIIRATYLYAGNTLAGTKGVSLSKKDAETTVIINRDAVNDSDLYLYTATGKAFYQTDKTDSSTIHTVPENSVVLLFKINDGQTEPEYVGMTTTDGYGNYAFGGLTSADYLVNVVFNYNGGTYTYDNGDAVSDGLSFLISGADVSWPNIIKQVNMTVNPNDPTVKPDEPIVEPEQPIPCVLSGYVFYDDAGIHTEDPIEGVDVYVYTQPGNAEIGHTATDEDGYWEIEGAPAGDYVAVFSYQGNASRVLRFTVTDSDYETGTKRLNPQYFDRTVETPTGTIRGIVLDENGRQMPALVAIYDETGNLSDFAYTDVNGFYEFTVVAGYTYRVKILKVATEETHLTAGYPGDGLTELNYYTISGRWGLNENYRAGTLIAVFKQTDAGDYQLVTATLTDANGYYRAVVEEEGNYRVCPYIDSQVYDSYYISVGYEKERPNVTRAINGSYTLDGTDEYESLRLYKLQNNVAYLRASEDDVSKTAYHVIGLDAGLYRLELTHNGVTKTYFFTAPLGLSLDVNYYSTISGTVTDESGAPIMGATVELYRNGNKIGDTITTLANGKYAWENVVNGTYDVVIKAPNATAELADKTTKEDDSYGTSYPSGITSGNEWVLNINAHKITGQVTDGHGVGLENALVFFTEHGGTRWYVAEADENGNYVIGLGPARYDIEVRYEFDTKHQFGGSGYGYLDVVEDHDNVDFIVARYYETVQVLRNADDAAAPNAEVSIYFEDGTLFWSGTADEDGRGDVKLFPGKYVVRATYDGTSGSTTFEAKNDDTVNVYIDSVVYVTGKVTGTDGKALTDAIVYYDNGDGFSGHVYTNEDGDYSIAVPRTQLGTFTIHAEQGTYNGETVTASVNSDTTVNLTVDNKPGAETHVLSGIVTDEKGNLLENARVTIRWGNDKQNVATTSTNENGVYTFDVVDGTYYLTADYEAANGVVYTTNAETAAHVNGANVEKNLVVLMRYAVTVTVVDEAGTKIERATVRYTGAENGSATTGSDGTAVLNIAKGDYRFSASTESRMSEVKNVSVEGPTDVTLVLDIVGIRQDRPVATQYENRIWGYTYNPAGDPLEGSTATLCRYDLETDTWNPTGDVRTTNAEGYYEFDELEDGKYRVDLVYTDVTTAPAEHDGYVVTGMFTDDYGNRLNGVTVTLTMADSNETRTVVTGRNGTYVFGGVEAGKTYHVQAVDNRGEVIFDGDTFATDTGYSVSNTVTDVGGHVIPGATVVITDEDGYPVISTVTDENGQYRIFVDNLSSEYTTTITYPYSYSPIDTVTYVRDTSDRNAPYIRPSWFTISGVVYDDDDRPVEGATVILKTSDGDELQRQTTPADGSYLFDNLEDGKYIVEVVIDGGTKRVYEVDTRTGEVTDTTGPSPITVNVNDLTKGAATLVEPENGWFEGENTFSVISDTAAIVLVKKLDGTETEVFGDDDHVFTLEMDNGDEIIVILRGDADLDGEITTGDATCVARYLIGAFNPTPYGLRAIDVDCDDEISTGDATCIARSLIGAFTIPWKKD